MYHCPCVCVCVQFSGRFYDLVRYLIFVGLFMVAIITNGDSQEFFLRVTVDNTFAYNEYAFDQTFMDIQSHTQLWTFLNVTLLPNLFPEYNTAGHPLTRFETLVSSASIS